MKLTLGMTQRYQYDPTMGLKLRREDLPGILSLDQDLTRARLRYVNLVHIDDIQISLLFDLTSFHLGRQ